MFSRRSDKRGLILLKQSPCLVPKIWGGKKLTGPVGTPDGSDDPLGGSLEKLKNDGRPSLPIGEALVISTLSGFESTWNQTSLGRMIASERMSYLVKLIDTADHLSVQVHPSDEYAKIQGHKIGKSECWVILDAGLESGLYLGVKQGVNALKMREAIEAKANVSELLNFVPVKRGDFFYVPQGTAHAIGKDILLAEIQQVSGLTYRIWDWGRLENGVPRKLHIEEALDVMNFDSKANDLSYFQYKQNVLHNNSILLEAEDFVISSRNHDCNACERFFFSAQKRPRSILVLEGEVLIRVGVEKERLTVGQALVINCEQDYEATIVTQETEASYLLIE